MDDDLDDYKLETTWHKDPSHVVHISFNRDHRRAGPGVRKVDRWYRKKELGVGSCGVVHLETTGDGGRERAVKSIRKSMARRLNIDYRRELAAIMTFSRAKYQQHQIFVEFYGWFENPQFIFLAMEYLPLGDLSKHISEEIEEHDLKDISLQMLEGLKLMHSKGFAHRDLKPQNIFVYQKQPSWWIKIGDFGIAKRVKDCDATELRTTTGTQGYEAPEIRGYVEVDEANPSSVYTKVVDIWSLGCVIYKVVTNRVPFQSGREIRRFCDGKDPFPTEPLLGKLSTDGIGFLRSVLVTIPNVRPTADVALQNPWLTCNEEHVNSLPQMMSSCTKENSAQKEAYDRKNANNSGLEFFEDAGHKIGVNMQASTSRQTVVQPLVTLEKPPQHSAITANSLGESKKSIEGEKNSMSERSGMPGSYPSKVEDSKMETETSLDHNSHNFGPGKEVEGTKSQEFPSALLTQVTHFKGNETSNNSVKIPIRMIASSSRWERERLDSNSVWQMKSKGSGQFGRTLDNKRSNLSNPSRKKPIDRYTAPTRSQLVLPDRLRKLLPKAQPLRRRGDSAMLERNYPTAIAFYTLALESMPKNAILLSNRAAAYCALYNPYFAEVDAIAAVKSRPSYSIGWSRLGYARNEMRDMLGSWEAYQQAIASGGSSNAIQSGYEATSQQLAREDLRTAGSSVINPKANLIQEELDDRPLWMEELAETAATFFKYDPSNDSHSNTKKGFAPRKESIYW